MGEGNITIRVSLATYRRLLRVKGDIEARTGRLASFDDAVAELLGDPQSAREGGDGIGHQAERSTGS